MFTNMTVMTAKRRQISGVGRMLRCVGTMRKEGMEPERN